MKTCTKCGETKDFSEFYKNKNSKDGYYCACKECTKNRQKEKKKNLIMQLKAQIRVSVTIENKILKPEGKKICSSCKNIFSLSDIKKSGYCKSCSKTISLKRYYDCNDKIKEYRDSNKDKMKEYQKKYVGRYKEQKKEYDRAKWLKKKAEKEQQKLLSK